MVTPIHGDTPISGETELSTHRTTTQNNPPILYLMTYPSSMTHEEETLYVLRELKKTKAQRHKEFIARATLLYPIPF